MVGARRRARKVAPAVVSGLVSALAGAVVAGCASGGAAVPVAPPSSQSPGGSPLARDLDVAAPEPIAVRASRPEPSALTWPKPPDEGARGDEPSLRRRISRQRRPSERDVRALAAELLRRADEDEAGGASGEVSARITRRVAARREEARALLAKVARRSQVEVASLELLALADARTGQLQDAMKVLERAAESGELSVFGQTLRAICALELSQPADGDATFAAILPADVDPAFPYARAWLRFDRGDVHGAYTDLVHAARAFGDHRPAELAREVASFAAFARVPVEQVGAVLRGLPGPPLDVSHLLVHAYRHTGDYRLAVDASTLAADSAPSDEAKVLRHRSSLHYQLGQPAAAADSLVKAMSVAARCEPPCQKEQRAARRRAHDMGRFYHTVFATTQDTRYFDPARKLYGALRAAGEAGVAQLEQDLMRSKIGADPGAGVHTADVLVPFVRARHHVIKGCYRMFLARDPSLAGVLELRWALAASGEVTGMTSQPGPGDDGMAGVARCAMDRMRALPFPGRVVPGETRLTVSFELATKERRRQ